MNMSDNKLYPVVIVGAGIAGLSAANAFVQHEIDFVILEAKSKPGGRIETKQFPNHPAERIELAAQWIHGEKNELCELVKRSGHIHEKTSWEGEGEFLLPNGIKAHPSIVNEILEWIENMISYVEDTFGIEELQNNPSHYKEQRFSSMGAFLKEKFLEYLKDTEVFPGTEEYDLKVAVFQWGMSFQRIDNSCNQMKDLSLFRWSEFQVNPGEHYNNFKYGASCFVDQVLVGNIPKGRLICNTPVANIQWDPENHVLITARNGQQFYARSVLVTCSIGFLKHNLESLFSPPLPVDLREAINATGFGPIGKIYLRWEKPWWPSTLRGFQFLWPKEFINCCDGKDDPTEAEIKASWFKSITGFDPVLDCPSTLLAWLGGPEAVYVEGLSEAEVGHTCSRILTELTGHDVPVPSDVTITKWNTDEFIRGAYSYRSTQGDEIHGDITDALCKPVVKKDLSNDERPAVVLAGEALSRTHYSTIHGAYESGQHQADKIIDYLQRTGVTKSYANNTCSSNVNPTTKVIMGMEKGHLTDLELTCQITTKLLRDISMDD